MNQDLNNKNTNDNSLKKIFKTISIAIVMYIVFIIVCIFLLPIIMTIGLNGVALGIMLFVLGIITIMFLSIALITIWIIYLAIQIIKTIYKRLNKKNQKIFIIILIIAAILISSGIYLTIDYNYHNQNIYEVLNDSELFNIDYDDEVSYFMYNNKIYYFATEDNFKDEENPIRDLLYVMNKDGKNHKKLKESDKLRFPTFQFAYNNYAYYYTDFYKENMKINLKTGKITKLGNKDQYFFPSITNNKEIYTIENNDSYTSFKKVNLDNDEVISSIKINKNILATPYYLDYDNLNIYYYESENGSIYRNNDILYQVQNHNYNNGMKLDFEPISDSDEKEMTFLAVNDKYIYYSKYNLFYKIDINSKIESQIKTTLGEVTRISSGNNKDNYFYFDHKIYSLNMENDNFEIILNNIEKEPKEVYHIDNKLIFTFETSDDIKNGNSVIIYNTSNDKIKKYNKIKKINFDEKNMYLLCDTEDNYKVKVYKLKDN